MELNDKAVLVTGGGGGIGLGIGLALAREGCRVAITGRNEAKLRAAAAQFDGPPPIRFRACDVSDRQDVAQLFAWLQTDLWPLDILVNNAGIIVPNRRMSQLTPDDWDRMLAVNITGAFNCIHAVLPAMRERRSGLIVNISSIAGKRALMLSGPAYCASKFALTALGTTVGLEERENGIHVTNIYPGEADTPMLDSRPVPVPPEKRAQMLQPEDVAAAVVMVAKLPPRALVPELVITPLYQGYA
jgi:NAD(P)-dependent dehydrogenase (short-subunit alcohol dehydrogenase family)